MLPNNQNLRSSRVPSRSYIDKTTYDKIQRHLSDINDTISEDDIRNVKVNIGSTDTIPAGKEERALLLKEERERISTKITEKEFKEGRKINSPWNLIDE